MSTELKPRSKHYFLTQFAGAKREDGGDCRRLQVTGASSFRAPYFSIGKDEVLLFVQKLSTDINAITDIENPIYVNGIELYAASAVRLGWDLLDWFEDKLVEHNY